MEIIKGIWFFVQDQILGMKWLNRVVGNLLTSLGVDLESQLGAGLQFFIYDTVKIFVLLSVLIFGISYIQSYFPPERTKKILGRFHGLGANTLSALLGTVTPFCSCSSIPLFIGFTGAGLPLGVTFSFLISSPLVDLGSLVLLTSIFGGKIAIAYVVVGLVLAVAGGSLIEKLHLEEYVEEFIRSAGPVDLEAPELTTQDRLAFAKEQVLETVKKVAPYIVVGVGIGALIHNFIPESFVQEVLGGEKPVFCPLGDVHRCPHVCGYLWDHPSSGEPVCKRRWPGDDPRLYDGGDSAVAALNDHAAKGCKTKIVGHLYWNCSRWDHIDWLLI